MRILDAAWVLFGFSAAALTAGWWQATFVWAAVAFSFIAVATLAGGHVLDRWNEAKRAQWVGRIEALEQRVEVLQKSQAFHALR